MQGTLRWNDADSPATRENVNQALASGSFFWLDLDDSATDDHDATDLLTNTFHFHPLAVEDAERFGRRPKLESYDGFIYLVVGGALPDGSGTAEVHLFFNEHYVVTVHRGRCPALEDARRMAGHHHADAAAPPSLVVTYLVADALTDSFFPVLSTFDDRVDTLEDQILVQPTEAQLGELFDMKRHLLAIRKVVAPQRDVFASLADGMTEIPGMTDEASRYFRNLYDHLIRLSDLVDSYRDLLSGVMDTHISTVSNRLNVVMKQLTIIATIFLPLSFLTGFFGQNFAWMVTRITSMWVFLTFGIGLELAAVVFLVGIFWKRGWLGGPTN